MALTPLVAAVTAVGMAVAVAVPAQERALTQTREQLKAQEQVQSRTRDQLRAP